MTIGTIGGIAQGAIMPSFSLIFGLILDAFNDFGPDFLDKITEVSLYFLWAGFGAMATTYGTIRVILPSFNYNSSADRILELDIF